MTLLPPRLQFNTRHVWRGYLINTVTGDSSFHKKLLIVVPDSNWVRNFGALFFSSQAKVGYSRGGSRAVVTTTISSAVIYLVAANRDESWGVPENLDEVFVFNYQEILASGHDKTVQRVFRIYRSLGLMTGVYYIL